ncbi:MAG: hypothetical protein RJB66_786 [Pseudomonadota bacterium]|jgi:acyl carrier protein
MKHSEILLTIENVFRRIAPEVDFKKIDLTKPLSGQVEIDSYDFYNIIVNLEKEIGFRIPESLIRQAPHLNALIEQLEKIQTRSCRDQSK